MAANIPEEFKDLFTKVAFANLATLMADGSSQVTPVWVDYDGAYPLVVQGSRFQVQSHNSGSDIER